MNVWQKAGPIFRYFNYLSDLNFSKNSATELRIFQSSPFINEKWENEIKGYQKMILNANARSRIIAGLIHVFGYGITVLLLYLLIPEINREKLTLAIYVALASALWSLLDTIQDIIISIDQAKILEKVIKSDLAKLEETVKKDKSKESLVEIQIIPNLTFESLEVENVTYTYPNKQLPAVKYVSFSIKKGDVLALVGPNGSGKSTLIKLILRILKPQEGVIKLNGIHIENISLEDYYRLITAVFQDSSHFNLGLKELLSLGHANTDSDFDDACKFLENLLDSNDFLDKLPQGKNTIIGSQRTGAFEVSGGTWQAINITRAFTSEASLIILDEPFANLDPLTELRAYQKIFKELDNRTGILITHRLSSTKEAKKILVLDKGEIVGFGNHEELMTQGGLYYRLYNEQKKLYTNEGTSLSYEVG